jgi:hypothetical protein
MAVPYNAVDSGIELEADIDMYELERIRKETVVA